MPAHKVKLQINQGATFVDRVIWRTGATKATLAPVDLTGCRARAQVRSDIDSPDVLLEMTTENGRIVLGGPSGEIHITIDAATTAAFQWESGVYDLEIIFPNGQVTRFLEGGVTVSKGVTRDN
ncbi:hypothetical protein [Comamonas sp. lk]|uniref:hypothetical protein n=1 Tax=Comamonas sp. lk TaxID=2201272 RepID=UPI000EB29421|nr:hypothetical protein [Comamonas sp. lk]